MMRAHPERMRCLTRTVGAVVLLIVAAASGAGDRSTGKVLSVSADGVLRVQAAHDQLKVMPAGIALPPVGHPQRATARKALGELVFDKTVELAVDGEPDAAVVRARIFVAGQDIAPQLLSEGNAYALRDHPRTGELLRFELSARNARRGMWAYGEHTVP